MGGGSEGTHMMMPAPSNMAAGPTLSTTNTSKRDKERADKRASSEAWRRAHAILAETPLIRITGCEGHWSQAVNGAFLLMPTFDDEPPTFQKVLGPGIWLYQGEDLTWRISGEKHKRQRACGTFDGFAKSNPVNPGDLPDKAKDWEISQTSRMYKKQGLQVTRVKGSLVRLSIPKNLEAEAWRVAHCELQDKPAIIASGAKGMNADFINGQYHMAAGPKDRAPVFKKVKGNQFMWFTSDSFTWNIGEVIDQQQHTFVSYATSVPVRGASKTFQLPDEAEWTVRNGQTMLFFNNWEAQKEFTVKAVTVYDHVAGIMCLSDKKAEAKIPEILKKQLLKAEQKAAAGGAAGGAVGAKPSAGGKTDANTHSRKMGGRLEDESMDAFDTGYKPLGKFATDFKPKKGVEAYLREDCMKIEDLKQHTLPIIDVLCRACWEVAKRKEEEEDILTKYPGLTLDMCFAIVAFTLEVGFIMEDEGLDYPGFECEFYRQYNQALRKRSPNVMKHVAGYSHYLFKGLQMLPKYEGVLWRGIWEPNAVSMTVENYKPRMREVHWSSFSSATPDREIAASFAGDAGLVFRVEMHSSARDVRFLSALDEDERLILPNTKFVVDKVAHESEDGVWEIHLVESPGTYTF